jgi:hypothetical protein
MAPRKHQSAKTSEFPILDSNGLYASKIQGDGKKIEIIRELTLTSPGNCLFKALSDQLYGHPNEHGALRDATIAHMRVESDFYRQYMIVNPARRNPKRKTATAAAVPIDTSFHTEDELQKQFDIHVQKMGQQGEWADNMEVSAFASALNVHVRLWQADFHYTFSPRVYYASKDSSSGNRPVLNIAYHVSFHRLLSSPGRKLTWFRLGNTTPRFGILADHTPARPKSQSPYNHHHPRSDPASSETMRIWCRELPSVARLSLSLTPILLPKAPKAHPTSPTHPNPLKLSASSPTYRSCLSLD